MARVSSSDGWRDQFDWIKISEAYTSQAGDNILVDTSGGAVTIKLPSTARAGDEVRIMDSDSLFGTNNCTIDRNGKNIRSATSNIALSTNNVKAHFIFIDDTIGWNYTEVRIAGAGGGDVIAPGSNTANNIPQWDGADSKTLKDGLGLQTTVPDPGTDTDLVSAQGIREALNAIDQKKIKATYFETITSGTTSGTATKPAGAGADVDFIMDEWGTATDALVSTIENGKPTFKSPVNAAGNTITTTFDTAGAFTFSDTPDPAADHALIYVYTCYLKNFDVAEALWETELLDYVADHASTHTDGSDDIQDATNAQKGLATAAHITAIEANTTHASSDGSDHTFIDQDVTSGSSPTLDGANITNIDADTLIADVKEANVSAVKKGQPCADVGSSGTKFLVQLADCDNASLINLLGLSDADVVQNETGTVVHKGLLTNVDTQTTNSDLNPGAETWIAGQMLYVSQTPGGLTKTRPTSGRCIKACRSQKGNSASDTLLAIVHTNSICACAASGEDICSRMGDSAGVNKHSFKDYDSNEVAAIDSNGNLTISGTMGIGTISPDGKLEIVDIDKDTTFEVTTYSNGAFKLLDAPLFNYKKAYGSEGSPEAVVDNAVLGTHNFRGYQGGAFRTGAQIICQVDGTPSGTYVPGELRLVTYDNANNNYSLVMKSDGTVGVGTTTPGGKLCVNGGVTVGSDADAGDNNLRVEGNIIVEGTVDGVDIASIGTRGVSVKVIADDTALTTGDGKTHFTVTEELNGMNLVSVGVHVYTPSSSGLPTFQIHNLTDTVDMLTTEITIDETEYDSKDAATPAVIDTDNDDVATGDVLRFDCDVAGTGTKGMEIRMGFRLA